MCGTGKEDLARAYHAAGPRPQGPFISLSSAALSVHIAESQLFGSKKGAFTGSTEDVRGVIREADGGTLFFDEIGDMLKELQPKLLRVIETKRVMPLGTAREVPVDVRFVAATHVDFADAIGRGAFRQDLYVRVSQAIARLPPLRERREEIPWYVALAHERACDDEDGVPPISAEFVEACLLRSWAGENVRALMDDVDKAIDQAITKKAAAIGAEHLPAALATTTTAGGSTERKRRRNPNREAEEAALTARLREALKIVKTVREAAKLVGIGHSWAYDLLGRRR